MVSCLGSLVQSRCGEGGALQTNVTGLCGEHLQCSRSTRSSHSWRVCSPRLHCSGSRLLYRERALRGLRFHFRVLHKSADSAGPAFCAFPGGAAQAARSLTGALSPGAARLLLSAVPASVSERTSWVRAPCVCSGELASSHDPPGGCRPSRVSGGLWLETGSLFAVG